MIDQADPPPRLFSPFGVDKAIPTYEDEMNRYLIETPHSPEDCLALVKQVHAMGYLHNFDWGCKSGEHCGWMIVEAEDEMIARLAVPPLVRAKSRVVRLTRYDTAQIEEMHKQSANGKDAVVP